MSLSKPIEILIAIFMVGIVIAIHEFGHFISILYFFIISVNHISVIGVISLATHVRACLSAHVAHIGA